MSMTTDATTTGFESMSDLALAATTLELAYELERRRGSEEANRRLAPHGTSIDELERWCVEEADRSVGR